MLSAKPEAPTTTQLSRAIRLNGILLLAMGLVIYAQWYSGVFPLLWLDPVFVPSSLIAALACILCGSGLLALAGERRRVAAAAGVATIVVIVGALAAGDHLLTLRSLLPLPPLAAEVSSPLQIAPNSALGFILCATAIILALTPLHRPLVALLRMFCASLGGALGLSALLGYLSGFAAIYQWGLWRAMAFDVAVALVLLSGGLLLSLRHDYGSLFAWLALPIGVVGLSLTAGFTQAVVRSNLDGPMQRSLPLLILGVGLLTTAAAMLGAVLFWQVRQDAARITLLYEQILRSGIARAHAEHGLERANRALRTINASSRSINEASDEAMMLHEICAAIVAQGGYKLAWVGLAENDHARTIRPVAAAGDPTGYVAQLELSWADEPRGRSPAGRAIREQHLVIAQDLATEPDLASWRAAAAAAGLQASVAIPLADQASLRGVLCLYSGEPNAFDAAEVALLTQLGADLSFGLEAQRRQVAQRRDRQSLLAERRLLQQISATSPVGLIVIEADGQISYANPYAEHVLGVSREQITARRYNAPEWQITSLEGEPFADEALPFTRVMTQGQPVYDLRQALTWPNGQRVLLSVNGAPLHDEQGQLSAVVCALSDITSAVSMQQALARSNLELEQLVAARTNEIQHVNAQLSSELIEQARLTTALEERERFIHQIADYSPNILLLYDLAQAQWLYLNRAVLPMLGYSIAELQQLGRAAFAQLLDYDERQKLKQHTAQLHAVREGESAYMEFAVRHRDGSRRWVAVRSVVFSRDQAGAPRAILSTARDMTRQRADAQALHESHQQLEYSLATLAQQTNELTLLGELGRLLQLCANRDEIVLVLARGLPKLFPEASGTIMLRDDADSPLCPLVHWGETPLPAHCDLSRCWVLNTARTQRSQGQLIQPPCQARAQSNRQMVICVPIRAYDQTYGICTLVADADAATPEALAQQRERREHLIVALANQLSLSLANLALRGSLHELATHDPLSGLLNRRALDEALMREVRRARRAEQPLAMLMLDIDYFKRVNDGYGHGAGDAVLVALAQHIRAHTRAEDLACRYGGEEFLLMLPETTQAEALGRAEELRELVAQLRLTSDGAELPPITVSIGLAVFPADASNGAELIHVADSALYRAKQRGRNRVVCASDVLDLTSLGDQ